MSDDDRSRTKGERDWEIEDPESEREAISRMLKRIEGVYAELDALSDVTHEQALKEIRAAIEAFVDERGE